MIRFLVNRLFEGGHDIKGDGHNRNQSAQGQSHQIYEGASFFAQVFNVCH